MMETPGLGHRETWGTRPLYIQTKLLQCKWLKLVRIYFVCWFDS